MMSRHTAKKIAYICVILVLVLTILYSGLRILESTVFSSQKGSDYEVSGIYEKDGVEYILRSDITVVMLLGIDETGEVQKSQSYNNTGEADMVALLIFNETTKKCDVLSLNRDTMLEMPALGLRGENAGTFYGQLALSHTYGDGMEQSCENTLTAVSNFMKGIEINHYMALNMDAIKILNDAVGGVKVNVKEDFSQVDASIPMGEHILKGDQALNYVRIREDVGDQLNISRMDRHSQYMQGFLQAFRSASESESFALDIYGEVSPYMVTDFTSKSLSALVSRFGDYELGEIIAVNQGKNTVVGGHYQFVADEEYVEELALRFFYKPRNT
jgi:LCP family protein required for cell wall assembly